MANSPAEREAMYTHVTVQLKYGATAEFTATMTRVVDIVTKDAGWELSEALIQVDGRLHTLRHIWKMRDMNHYYEGGAVLQSHADWPELAERLNALIIQEEITFAVPAPYSPNAEAS
jgi:hypothetical protein